MPGTSKNETSQLFAANLTTGGKNLLTEGGYYLTPYFSIGHKKLVPDLIGIYYESPKFSQKPGNSAFAATDSTVKTVNFQD